MSTVIERKPQQRREATVNRRSNWSRVTSDNEVAQAATLQSVALWQFSACPLNTPSMRDADVAMGCHFEEFVEMLDAMQLDADHQAILMDGRTILHTLALHLKSGVAHVRDVNRRELVDALADQVVTAVGVGHRMQMDVPLAVHRVDASNWSKFDSHGQPVFDANGKVQKGPNYKAPDLEGCY